MVAGLEVISGCQRVPSIPTPPPRSPLALRAGGGQQAGGLMGNELKALGSSTQGRHVLITADGVRITIQPMPQSRAIMVWTHDRNNGKMQQFVVPLDMVGAFTVSCEAAARTATREKNGPGTEARDMSNYVEKYLAKGADSAADRSVLRCLDADACKAGQAECPHFHLCCSAGAVL